jgi:hypothetical protein
MAPYLPGTKRKVARYNPCAGTPGPPTRATALIRAEVPQEVKPMKAETRPKPSNAKWLDAANVEGECDHPLRKVEVAWYREGRVKVGFPNGTPAVIRQAYLEGDDNDLILEVAPRSDA